jgi:ribosomal protein L7/L12
MREVFKFEANLDRPTIPVDVETELKVHLKLESRSDLVVLAPETARAMITNICLVFDCSGSMAGQKRETAIEAAKMIVGTVHERHRLSLVGFSTKARVLVDNAQPTREGKDGIEQKIDKQIRAFPRGTTNLADGLRKAAQVLDKERADAKVMIILSDGGADSPKQAQTAGLLATNAGIQLFAVGIGDGYEADALLRLVTPSNGAVFGESDLEKIKSTFEVLIGRIESFVATNTFLVVTLGERVRAGTVYKTSPEQALIGKMAPDAKSQLKLHVGNIEQGQSYGFLVTVTAPAQSAGKRLLARAALLYDAPSLGLRDQKVELEIPVDYAKGSLKPANAEVDAAFRGVQFVELAEGLAGAQRRGDAQASADILQQLIRRADGEAEATAFYEDVLDELNERGKIAQQRLNALVLGSTSMLRQKKKGPQLYEVVLVDAGASVIPFFRELRRLTGMDLRAIKDLVRAAPASIQVLPLMEARALKKELQGTGARIEVRPRTTNPPLT